jgi:spore maturation protein CgeB
MKFVLFCHSFTSCWNHGNAHFLRGIARSLLRRGHDVTVYEPEDGWSLTNALIDGGEALLADGERLVSGVDLVRYRQSAPDLDEATAAADVVLVHEWSSPALVAALGALRARGGRFLLLFHDTHHRMVSAPAEAEALKLDGYDGVLAFGASLRDRYDARGWGARAFTWHEAADTSLFRPHDERDVDTDVVWIGNWGDGERSDELEAFLVSPVAELGLRTRIHGVRYPDAVRARLAASGIWFGGWLPNHRVPDAFASARLTVHVPRRVYVDLLPGVPTIRMFEALACGIPLISAPWRDEEKLFPAGCYLKACDTASMAAAMSLIMRDRYLAEELRSNGLAAIEARHSCAHRVTQLLDIVEGLRAPEAFVRRGADAPAREVVAS